jgi:hypothetical protein
VQGAAYGRRHDAAATLGKAKKARAVFEPHGLEFIQDLMDV